MSRSVLFLGTGKMSTFGGPDDSGVGPNEGLALVGRNDLGIWPWSSLFLPYQPYGTTGLARRLDPKAFYIAMRWDELLKPFGVSYFIAPGAVHDDAIAMVRHSYVRLTNPRNKLTIFARPVDYGPGDGRVIDGKQDPDTGRLADLSPGAAAALGLVTDQLVSCELILPQMEATS